MKESQQNNNALIDELQNYFQNFDGDVNLISNAVYSAIKENLEWDEEGLAAIFGTAKSFEDHLDFSYAQKSNAPSKNTFEFSDETKMLNIVVGENKTLFLFGNGKSPNFRIYNYKNGNKINNVELIYANNPYIIDDPLYAEHGLLYRIIDSYTAKDGDVLVSKDMLARSKNKAEDAINLEGAQIDSDFSNFLSLIDNELKCSKITFGKKVSQNDLLILNETFNCVNNILKQPYEFDLGELTQILNALLFNKKSAAAEGKNAEFSDMIDKIADGKYNGVIRNFVGRDGKEYLLKMDQVNKFLNMEIQSAKGEKLLKYLLSETNNANDCVGFTLYRKLLGENDHVLNTFTFNITGNTLKFMALGKEDSLSTNTLDPIDIELKFGNSSGMALKQIMKGKAVTNQPELQPQAQFE